MQVCVVVKAQTRLWQARSLRMYTWRLGELAKDKEHARHLFSAKLVVQPRP